MAQLNPLIDDFLQEGCGRCPLGGTPECKVHTWSSELKLLRKIVLSSGLTEELKWKQPCYTLDGKNVVIVSAFKDSAILSFFKGALLNDSEGILEKAGENSQSARLLRFTSTKSIRAVESTLKAYLAQAIQIERDGLRVPMNAKHELVLPEELEKKFESLPQLREAFEALTPGRQRGYIIFITGAKQSKTREARIDKCIPQIMEGRGLHD